jgi:hypothetical protein
MEESIYLFFTCTCVSWYRFYKNEAVEKMATMRTGGNYCYRHHIMVPNFSLFASETRLNHVCYNIKIYTIKAEINYP